MSKSTQDLIGIFLANHNADSGMRFWDISRWQQEIRDLKRMGAKTIWFLPIQFGQREPADFESNSVHWSLQVGIAESIADAGLKVGIYQGLNDVFPQTLETNPNWAAHSGKYFLEEAHACPSLPEAWIEIQRLRRRLFAELPQIDFLITPATDYGGCSCDLCAPWASTYMKCFEEQSALCREFHPAARIVAAGHGLGADEEEALRELISEADWVDYVADIPRGAGKPAIKYYMAPEITMLDGWGKYGPCPVLQIIEYCYRNDNEGVRGWVPYSEGIHDDVNKFACLRLASDSTATAQSAALDYTVEWLGLLGDAAEEFSQVILGLGRVVTNSNIYLNPFDPTHDPAVDRRVAQLIKHRKDHPHLVSNHRYWLLQLRAVSEALSLHCGQLTINELEAEAAEVSSALARLEPAYSRFLAAQHPAYRQEKGTWVWPRKLSSYWKTEVIGAALNPLNALSEV